MPGNAEVSVDVLVLNEGAVPKVDEALKAAFDDVREQQPMDSGVVDIEVEETDDSVKLTITPSLGSNEDPRKGVRAAARSEGVRRSDSRSRKRWGLLHCNLYQNGDTEFQFVDGFVIAENGWESGGGVPAVTVPGTPSRDK